MNKQDKLNKLNFEIQLARNELFALELEREKLADQLRQEMALEHLEQWDDVERWVAHTLAQPEQKWEWGNPECPKWTKTSQAYGDPDKR